MDAGRDWDAEAQRLRNEHAAEVRRAMDNGDAPPPVMRTPDGRPDVQAIINGTHADLARITDEEKAWLAANAPELLVTMYRQEQRLVRLAEPLVKQLADLVPEWGEIAETADRLRRTKGGGPPANVTVTAGSIVDAVLAGRGWVPRPDREVPAPPAPKQDTVARGEHQRKLHDMLAQRDHRRTHPR